MKLRRYQVYPETMTYIGIELVYYKTKNSLLVETQTYNYKYELKYVVEQALTAATGTIFFPPSTPPFTPSVDNIP